MPKEVFDQDRPRSAMASDSTKRSRDAMSGPSPRQLAQRSDLDIAPWMSGPADSPQTEPESRAA